MMSRLEACSSKNCYNAFKTIKTENNKYCNYSYTLCLQNVAQKLFKSTPENLSKYIFFF